MNGPLVENHCRFFIFVNSLASFSFFEGFVGPFNFYKVYLSNELKVFFAILELSQQPDCCIGSRFVSGFLQIRAFSQVIGRYIVKKASL